MSRNKIIGLLGHAGCGKDTVAQMIFDYVCSASIISNTQFVAFADPLKRFCKEVFNFSPRQLYGPSEERNKPDERYPTPSGGFLTPRKALQTLGTDWGRALYEDVWVDYGLRRAKTLAAVSTNLFIVITDLRFINEARKIHEAGQVWRITRPGAEGDGHASERDQDSRDIKPFIDVEILNDGTLDDLRKKVYAELEKLHHADQG